jgi:hypothetical protein
MRGVLGRRLPLPAVTKGHAGRHGHRPPPGTGRPPMWGHPGVARHRSEVLPFSRVH